MLDLIKIVLVGTTHPGNIGAVARAMKNMGLSRLALVDPKIFPSADATSRASGAHDLLANAEVVETLDQAIADCSLVFGASARSRTITWPEKSARECADMAKANLETPTAPIAFVFGREHSGLTNKELDRCQYLLRIPCNPDFSSLNLAAAVQVVCYELLLASQASEANSRVEEPESPPVTAAQLELFFQHLASTLTDIGFIHPDKSKSIMRRLRRLFNRSNLESKEVDILRGILSATQKHKPND